MKALSVKQPWAWLICKGIKDVENRTWYIHMPPLLNYPATPRCIYIHTGKVKDTLQGCRRAFAILERVQGKEKADIIRASFWNSGFELGAIIGEVDIVGCKFRRGDMNANLFSPWHEVGMYGLLLANPVLYHEPYPCKGRLGFFEPDVALPGRDSHS